ncbi:hypothetical protein Back2_28600 [Nocardioides baekrokdamisoli]|uniref:Uncharacterized protein n=1 Tax=Nocardioides baekrokdamisoli TaxID=1804624 RepID=A0A3G9J1N3_9ACTN|nr:hypothetical protein [Nocardioides baekrokdamisoli]BBH18573.1 hypothetical protein Back2_28600 [Nocardioides baekrokdamisoli]
MSYDLAVWEGEQPISDAAALDCYLKLMDRMESGDHEPTPTPAIMAFVEALTARWPDTDEAWDDDETPWADAPIINNAFGDAIYFAMTYSGAERAVPFAAQCASELGLVCFDPQAESLVSAR